MKICKNCNTEETLKWYSGPLCKQCYRKQLLINNKAVGKIEHTSKWAKANKGYLRCKNKEWYYLNHEAQLEYQAEYRIKNKENKKIWEQNDRKSNINRHIADNLRSRLNKAIKNTYKSGSAVNDLGCSIEALKTHLESKFQVNMAWYNYGSSWHIDHIRPLSSFDLTVLEEFKVACHYTNLQPLWAKDNLRKGAKYG